MTPKTPLYRCKDVEATKRCAPVDAALASLQPDLERLAASFARSAHDPSMDADDFVQEARLAVIEAWESAKGMADPLGYLKTVATRALGKLSSQQQSRSAREKSYLKTEEARHEAQVEPENIPLHLLSPEDAALIQMSVVEGRTLREIEEITGVARSTLHDRKTRALATLKSHLEGE